MELGAKLANWVVPARAGMSPLMTEAKVAARSGPRASGDEPGASTVADSGAQWSPRERG